MDELLKNLNFLKLRVQLKAEKQINLPFYIGSMLKGAFLKSFLDIACLFPKKKDCNNCVVSNNCVFYKLFKRKAGTDFLNYKHNSIVPKPVVLLPEKIGIGLVQKGEVITFYISLFGAAVNYLSQIVYNLHYAVKKGYFGRTRRIRLHKIEAILPDREQVTLFSPKSDTFKIFDPANYLLFDYMKNFKTNNNNLTISFFTPLRLITNGKINKQISAQQFTTVLLRRLQSLVFFHGKNKDIAFNFDAKRLIDFSEKIKTETKNLKWIELDRYSSTQRRNVDMGGIFVTLFFYTQNSFDPDWVKLIYAGSFTHLGKGTIMGLGGYKIMEVK